LKRTALRIFLLLVAGAFALAVWLAGSCAWQNFGPDRLPLGTEGPAAPLSDPGVKDIPLEDVGKHVGERVSFVAEVKAVSFRNGNDTMFLNFGDAYPRQTLTVRVEPEFKDIYREFKKSLGWIVRVTGTVEENKYGKTIFVKEPDQLQEVWDVSIDLPYVATTPVGKAWEWLKMTKNRLCGRKGSPEVRLEGAAFRVRVSDQLRTMLRDGKYEELEAIAAAWRRPEARMTDGTWLLEVYGRAFYPPSSASKEAFERSRSRLEAWHNARPQALQPVILLARLETAYAWHARGIGRASAVTEEDWKLMSERLKNAITRLVFAMHRWSESPLWSECLQKVALGQQWPEPLAKLQFTAAAGAFPDYWPFYNAEVYRLFPRWQGKPGEWEAFSRSFSGDLGKELSVRLPWEADGNYNNIFRKADIPWSQMQEGFEFLIQKYPRSTRIKSAYALFAGMAEQRETCKRLLDELGDEVDMELWVTWEQVQKAKNWAVDPTKTPPSVLWLANSEGSKE